MNFGGLKIGYNSSLMEGFIELRKCSTNLRALKHGSTPENVVFE